MLKIAILGHDQEQEDSECIQQVCELTQWIIQNKHQFITTGFKSIDSVIDNDYQYLEGNYYENLERLHNMPDVWIFFPGYQATILQLHSLLHLIREGEIEMDHRLIILISEKGSSFALGAKNFYQNVADSTEGVIKIPWTRTTKIPLIYSLIEDLEILISQKQSDSQQEG